jgi:hypothetical protein
MSAEKKWFDSMIGEYIRLYTTNAVLHGQLLEHDEDVAVIQGDGLPPLLVYKDYIISCSAAPVVRKDI